jgi:predicted flap endonuclease-1-like 5' DNA nuclease
MVVISNPRTWPLDNQQTRAKKGKLVRVQRGRGMFVKMYEADAIAQGLIPGKAKPQAENKMRVPGENKTLSAAPAAELPKPDDFTTIPGIGPASARALVAHGITTFEQLREAVSISYLTSKARDSIEAWRNNG